MKKTYFAPEVSKVSFDTEEIMEFSFTGNGFLYNMVRIMVGTLLEVGQHKREPDTIPQLFGAKREQAGPLVPAQGLCLTEVTY